MGRATGRNGIAALSYMYCALRYCRFLWSRIDLRLCGGATAPDHTHCALPRAEQEALTTTSEIGARTRQKVPAGAERVLLQPSFHSRIRILAMTMRVPEHFSSSIPGHGYSGRRWRPRSMNYGVVCERVYAC